jgi:hypothetical protein
MTDTLNYMTDTLNYMTAHFPGLVHILQ